MSYDLIRAGINLYAVLKNMEDLIELDAESRDLIRGKNISIQFIVRKGPKAWLKFENQSCRAGRGKIKSPDIILWFASAAHLNKMFDGKANPVPLKGFMKIGFLQNEFTKISDKLSYYLKPEDVIDPDEEYLKINTRMTLNVAGFAVPEIGLYDKKAIMSASRIPDGKIQLNILPNGPSVYLTANKGKLSASKGLTDNPHAIMEMRDYMVANDFLNGKTNPFKAIASGEVSIRGQIPMLDNLSLILDKVQSYVS